MLVLYSANGGAGDYQTILFSNNGSGSNARIHGQDLGSYKGGLVFDVSDRSGGGDATVEKLRLNTDGAKVSGTLTINVDKSSGIDSGDLGFANGKSLRWRNSADNAWINCMTFNSAGNLYLGPNGSTTQIFFGISGIGDVAFFDTTGSLIPNVNNAYDLGKSTSRWRDIYTNDLNLSNEGGANDVDGTWGDYTIQEGESDLFLINKRNGKKYKFNLTEVS